MGETVDDQELSPEAVQLALSTVCLVCEQFLEEPDQVIFLDEIEAHLETVTTPSYELDSQLRGQVHRIRQEFREARYLIRVQLRDPPSDLET